MTSRQRLLTALQNKKPDRVPVTCFFADQGHFINQLYPQIDPWDFEAIQLKIVEFQKEMGFDVFVRTTYWDRNYTPYFLYGGLNANRQTENWTVKKEYSHNGSSLVETATITTPKGTVTQDFMINEIRPGTFMYMCTKKPIETYEDLLAVMEYEPGLTPEEEEIIKTRAQVLKKAVGEDGITGCWTPGGSFNNAACLIECDQLYCMGVTDPEFYDDLMKFSNRRMAPILKVERDSGFDVLIRGGNVGGAFLGKPYFEEYILPYEQEFSRLCRKENVYQLYHNCGAVMGLVESYKELGVDAVEPFSPDPLGDGRLGEARRRIDGAYAVIAGLDQVNVIQKGTKADVEASTRDLMAQGKEMGGGFIMQNVDFFEYGTPVENVECFCRTALECAQYDE